MFDFISTCVFFFVLHPSQNKTSSLGRQSRLFSNNKLNSSNNNLLSSGGRDYKSSSSNLLSGSGDYKTSSSNLLSGGGVGYKSTSNNNLFGGGGYKSSSSPYSSPHTPTSPTVGAGSPLRRPYHDATTTDSSESGSEPVPRAKVSGAGLALNIGDSLNPPEVQIYSRSIIELKIS